MRGLYNLVRPGRLTSAVFARLPWVSWHIYSRLELDGRCPPPAHNPRRQAERRHTRVANGFRRPPSGRSSPLPATYSSFPRLRARSFCSGPSTPRGRRCSSACIGPDGPLAEILVLMVAILATIRAFWRVDRPAGLLLFPYAAWVAFASVLNCAICG